MEARTLMPHTLDVSSRISKDSSDRFVKVPRIFYSADRSHASRNGVKKFYALDSRTGLPVTPDKRGFFRVRKSVSDLESIFVEYRIGTKLFSAKKDSVIIMSGAGKSGAIVPEDILNSALFLMERDALRTHIENSIRGKNVIGDKREAWVGNYPEKNIHTVN